MCADVGSGCPLAETPTVRRISSSCGGLALPQRFYERDTGRAMSRENVELVTGLQPAPEADIAVLFREDASRAALREAGPLFHPDFVAETSSGPQAIGLKTSYRGLDGLIELWLDWLEPWESYRTETEEAIDLGDQVLLLVRDYGRRQGMEREVTLLGAALWTIADGKITRAVFYADRAAALEAVGLSE